MLLDSQTQPEQETATRFFETLYAWHENSTCPQIGPVLDDCNFYFNSHDYFVASRGVSWQYTIKTFKNPNEDLIAVIKIIHPEEDDEGYESGGNMLHLKNSNQTEDRIVVIDFFDFKNKVMHRIEPENKSDGKTFLKSVDLKDKEIKRIKRRFENTYDVNENGEFSVKDLYNDFPIQEKRFRYNMTG